METILTPIYESAFLGFSYGFRPGRGAHDALDALAVGMERRKINWVVDADIRGFFDNVSRDWMVRFLEHRIADKRVIRLITKWLNAGVTEDGEWRDNMRGTPQGSVISPILANIYLHYALDLWFQKKWRTHEAKGDTIIVRYADDFVVGFQHKQDAERFLHELKARLGRFGLELHPDKTRLIEFGRFAISNRRERGLGKPETFDFLGFTHYCTKDKKGWFQLGRKPIARRMIRTLKRIREELRRRMHHDVKETGRWLGQVLNGWLNYFAVPTSFRTLQCFALQLKKLWLKILRRRSQKDRHDWAQLERHRDMLAPAENPTPVAAPTSRRHFDPREEPCALTCPHGSARGVPSNGDPYRDSMVELCSHSATERAGMETLHLRMRAPVNATRWSTVTCPTTSARSLTPS